MVLLHGSEKSAAELTEAVGERGKSLTNLLVVD